MKRTCFALLLVTLVAGCKSTPKEKSVSAAPQPWVNTDGFTNTPIIPGTPWHVHDPSRTQPERIIPGTFSTQEKPGLPPSDAIVLFNGTDITKWQDRQGAPAKWKIENGELIESKGDIVTRDQFGDIQLHLEFATPTPPKGNSQGRGNSGVFLMGKYEVQVLDSYQNPTYADGTLGALYAQHPPLANVARPPGQWQVYDIVFHPPRFADGGALISPAYATVFLNGVVIQDRQHFDGPTAWKTLGSYSPQPATGPIALQDHNNTTRFRNIWVRPLRADEKS